MTDSRADSVEILVHISASCKTSDDKRYRKEAKSILRCFYSPDRGHHRPQPKTQAEVPATQGVYCTGDHRLGPNAQEEGLAKHSQITEKSQPSSLSSGVAFGEVPRVQVLETPLAPLAHGHVTLHQGLGAPPNERSSFAVRETPVVVVARTPHTENMSHRTTDDRTAAAVPEDILTKPVVPSSPKTPPSTVPESASLYSRSPEFSRKRKFPTQNSPSQPPEENGITTPKRPRIEESLPHWLNEPNSSPSLRKRSPLKIVSTRNSSSNYQRAAARERHSIEGKPSASINEKQANLLKAPSKRNVNDGSKQQIEHVPEPTQLSLRKSSPSKGQALEPNHVVTEATASVISRALHAPLPDTDEADFTTHKVKLLASASNNQSIASHYRPLEVRRDIELLERGYWRFPIPDSWSDEARDKFKEYVEQFVTEGRAGWGTWVEQVMVKKVATQFESPEFEWVETWQGAVRVRNTALNSGVGSGEKEQQQCELRFWCWGEVVKEVWLAIYLGGHRYMRGLGMTWVDSVGEVVVRME
ncbi:MAG: hypothetical protein LQ340_005128 [Diploschistes diacapsis]|nr:MAG: hypothetical protein LQ340_005128 [Diploschistes diacapsis]